MPKKYSSEEGYDKYASFYDKKLKFLGSFEDGAIENLVSDLSGKSMLDVGSGTGRVLDMLKDKNMLAKAGSVHALDISGEMLKILKRKHPKVEAEKGDVQNMPYKDESFDIVVAAFVIVHLKSLEEFFDEVWRVLKPNGVFILTNINQRKAPKLLTEQGEELVIESHYNLPKHVVKDLENSFFKVEANIFRRSGDVWTNQIIKAVKI
ncbi:MAG: hypothetical protein ACD_51C00093G0006 [uncultured bacterium]|nr:MAG: hypothetical protein ACD_51C00093G0006 [uncultured bacterium]OGJ48532.1 MAG: hypothetical protein A2244_02465 [Candidatus Peregrinibacteria bacterium RIFOXYA2_FULL_41_18]OGJ48863.1 MAG: hypothetical protein A2344_02865 [Candidatus Peregrinibacteria bacterium RIFOXYB12_FULL_41_12]OGJ53428.1 MAG: hypothetical protein A2448_01945 [Candidatus Peregrinibacteria bacterium RIFOXYC2_FULL_41_22]